MNIETYMSHQQFSKQWGDILFSMAREMELQIDQKTLAKVMYQTGVRMASGFPVVNGQSFSAVEQVINEIWMACNWGWVCLTESEHCISIEHHYSPLSSAFGHQADSWTGELLAGFYASVFDQLGAEPDLHLRRISSDSSDHNILFELSVI